MAVIRFILGKIILFLDFIFSPTPKARSLDELDSLKQKTAHMMVYQFEACPFCVKVRRALKAENIPITFVDAKSDPFKTELLQGGGKLQVPCLRITKENGKAEWMYESSAIIHFLKEQLA
ncbi:MAG: glutathione S-transferase N-terminal domain-containing protein [Oligoflexia bacterium]|nr:glutathione S-transferase N-terminal domain-containing protein [Oligoflexia bacterium]